MQVHLSRPDITQKEIDAVNEVLKSPNLALGPKMREFEQAFASYIGKKHAISVNSGTSGLFLCLRALGIGPGDQVITTPFTFIASATTIMMTGAEPVFVDIDPNTLNIDPRKISDMVTHKTRAILPVEVFGNPDGFDGITKVAQENNLPVIEDSCEALGSKLNNKMVGTFGQLSTFAFYPNKQITTGEGGIILTDDQHLADLCISMRNQGRGKNSGWLGHERLGYNFRLSDINCALGLVQLARIEEIKAKRKQVAHRYQQLLSYEDRLIVPQECPECDVSWFVFVVRLAANPGRKKRDQILNKLRERGIQVSNYFPPVHLQPFIAKELGYKSGDMPVTEKVCNSTIALPFYNNLSEQEANIVCENLRQVLDQEM